MGHRQTGYAIVEVAYDIWYTEEYTERGREAIHLPAVSETKRRRGYNNRRLTYFAQCRRNETGDDKLSQWYKSVARPVVESEFEEQIRVSNTASQGRMENWKEMWRRGAPNLPPPPLFTYDEFNTALVKVKKIYVSPDIPSNTKAEQLEWLPSTTQYHQRGVSPRM